MQMPVKPQSQPSVRNNLCCFVGPLDDVPVEDERMCFYSIVHEEKVKRYNTNLVVFLIS